jgi:hypothetical protein
MASLNSPWRPAAALLTLLVLLTLLWPALASAQVADADAAYYRRASSCAAVLKRDVVGLSERFQRGEPSVRNEIQRLTEQTFTFIGIAYKRGLRNPQADQMLDEAERAQQKLPALALRQLSSDCQAEGARLLAASNAIERALVRNRAKARVEHLLAGKTGQS